MLFTQQPPNEGYPILRMSSESDLWEMGIRPVLYGYRVSAGKTGTLFYSLDYCCGDSRQWILRVITVLEIALERIPETAQLSEVEKLFPRQQFKPMQQDPDCWKRLLDLSVNTKLNT